MGGAMIKAGYSATVAAKPALLTRSKGWQELLAEIDDQPLLQRLREIAMDRTDKRAALQSINTILQLKDRFPAGKLKLLAVHQELQGLEE